MSGNTAVRWVTGKSQHWVNDIQSILMANAINFSRLNYVIVSVHSWKLSTFKARAFHVTAPAPEKESLTIHGEAPSMHQPCSAAAGAAVSMPDCVSCPCTACSGTTLWSPADSVQSSRPVVPSSEHPDGNWPSSTSGACAAASHSGRSVSGLSCGDGLHRTRRCDDGSVRTFHCVRRRGGDDGGTIRCDAVGGGVIR